MPYEPCVLLTVVDLLVPGLYTGNQVMGEIRTEGKMKVEKTSGLWTMDNVGYVKGLKGSKKDLLAPRRTDHLYPPDRITP